MYMRTKHQRTLARVFARPTRSGIRWADIESLLQALGVEIIEAAGSRVHLVGDSKAIVVHRPHPRPETARATVRQIATFLTDIGVTP